MKKRFFILWGVLCWGLFSQSQIYGAKSGQAKIWNFKLKNQSFRKAETMKMIKLKNGLEAVIQENHSAPVVSVQVWVKAGSKDESDDLAGVAHLIEHMIFKGSEKFGPGEVASLVESKGGEINAFTTNDFTVYYVTISSRFFELALEALSDSIFKPEFDEDELEREREVVLEEIRRQEDNPRVKLYQELMALSYQSHPYRRPVIGYQDTVGKMERKQILSFWDCYYQPSNIIVSIVGDLNREQTEKLVKKYFGNLKTPGISCSLSEVRNLSEPAQNQLRTKFKFSQLEQGYIYLGFKIPEFGHPDMPALDLLATILGQGESSRLVETVRNEQKLVHQVWSYSSTPKGPGLFIIGASLEPKNLLKASEAITSQIASIKKSGVQDWELERAKRQIESDAIYARETMQGNARRIGFFSALISDPGYEEKYLSNIEKVSAQEIQKITKKYLTSFSLNFVGLLPASASLPAKPNQLEEELKGVVSRAEEKLSEPVKSGYQPLISSSPLWPLSQPASKPQIVSLPKRFVLKNGIRLLVRENQYVPIVSVRAGFLGGLRFENEQTNGVFNLIAEMLTEGTKTMNSNEIHREIESLAGSITGFSGRNSFGLTMTVPSPNFEKSLGLLASLIQEPVFPEEDLNRVRGLVLASLRREQDQPRILVNNLFFETLYTQHPYRLNPLGKEESLKKLTREELLNFYQLFSVPEKLVIAISGDVNGEQVKAKLEELFQGWEKSSESIAPPAPEPGFDQLREKIITRKASQTQIMVGWLGAEISSPDQPGIEVLSEILAGMSGRLFVELRDKKSLAYELGAYHLEGIETGYISGYIGCAPEKKPEAINGILTEFEKLKEESVSEEELNRAKNSLIGSYEIGLQNNLNVASHMFFDEVFNLEFGHWQRYAERIEKVSAEDIQRVAKKYLTKGYALAIIEPGSVSGKNKNRLGK